MIQSYEYAKELCPQQCTDTGMDRANWTYYHDFEKLQHCEQTYLFEMAIYNPADSITLRGCTTGELTNTTKLRRATSFGPVVSDNSTLPNNQTTKPLACGAPGSAVDTRQAQLRTSWLGNGNDSSFDSTSSANAIIMATQQLQNFLSSDMDCNATMIFARSGDAVVGVYVGYQVQKTSAAAIAQQFIDDTKSKAPGGGVGIAEVCKDIQGVILSSQTIGLFVSADGNLTAAQEALVNWDSGRCQLSSSETTTNIPATIKVLSGVLGGGSTVSDNTGTLTSRATSGTCSYVQIVKDDSCWSLATQKCKISTDDFYKYNANGNSDKFCAGIQPGDYVCCSAGSLPDFSPKPNADGSCASYTVVSGDTCKGIADSHSIKDWTKLDTYNKNTWGWSGCSNGVQLGQIMCVSSGTPNMPAPNNNAICGPQVVGTKKPTNGTDWSLLNQCPLNACCDVWGQCGTYIYIQGRETILSLSLH
jgi:chitinase